MADATDTLQRRFTIENRTGEAADLTYVDRTTMRPGRLRIASGGAGALVGDPAEVKWLNAPPPPPPFLSTAEADALDAAREPGAPIWVGLAHRVEPAPPAEVDGL